MKNLRWDAVFTALFALGLSAGLFAYRHAGLGYFDASEFSLVVRAGGLPHAPGYPLYVLLGKFLNLFARDPFLAQFALSLAALMVAATFLYFSLAPSGGEAPRRAALLTVILFLSSRDNELFTVLPDVFILNLALFAGLGWAIRRWYESRDPRRIFAVFAIYGLGLCHHHTLALTLPAFGTLFVLRRSAWRDPRTYGYALAGFALGSLPLLYLVRPLPSPSTEYTYYFVRTLKDFAFVLLRRGYGTLNLYAGGGTYSFFRTTGAVLRGLLRDFHLIAWLPLLLFAFRRWRPKRRVAVDPLMVYSLVTLLAFVVVFVGRNNIPLTSPHLRMIFGRFVTVPSLLLLYPIHRALERVFDRKHPAWLYPAALALLALATGLNFGDLDFRRDELLEAHVQMAYARVFKDSPPPSDVAPDHYKCALFVDGDAMTFGLKYHNQFRAEKKCFVFGLTSFSGAFRSRYEEALQQRAFGDDFPRLLKSLDPNALVVELFKTLERMGYRIYAFPGEALSLFDGAFTLTPKANIFELATQRSAPPLRAEREAYLRGLSGYLGDHPALPSYAIDETAGPEIFYNLEVYKKLDAAGLSPELQALEAQVRARISAASNAADG